jgi:hypothetical protein
LHFYRFQLHQFIKLRFININAALKVSHTVFNILQENNAIAVFDMQTEQIEDIRGLGYKNWNDFTLDVSDKDGG